MLLVEFFEDVSRQERWNCWRNQPLPWPQSSNLGGAGASKTTLMFPAERRMLEVGLVWRHHCWGKTLNE